MARLSCLVVTARLAGSVVVDPTSGIALDGLLASRLRSATGGRASDTDGGLHVGAPTGWELPLARCGDPGGPDWHWLATCGHLVDADGRPVPWDPDVHRVAQTLRTRRAEETVGVLPAAVPHTRKRFRHRTTPVIACPAAAIVWRAVGDPEAVLGLLDGVPAVGARRGSGEGAVLSWQVEATVPGDPDRHGHTHSDGSLGRPVPARCAARFGFDGPVVPGGIRPPLFHPAHQMLLVHPDLLWANSRTGG